MDEKELSHQIAQGDEAAFSTLFYAYVDILQTFIMRLTRSAQIRRLAYPSNEYTTNGGAVNAAVANLLNGPDNGGTRLWWDTGGSNF